ncbi:hypothetical protein [Carboxylicivirga sp. M1479]|uniref:hypothetical protein n=1 Tax=Carboxylicivirga sp. M1479 TaxID=2594476 RepID=UPI0011780CDD|nr:hypothetical protein [Carboxylicivirga sp. M1479]TRX71501.1 hypothetical protein FNN09_05900 [Carboxylicivirga sp. M1479]
MSENTNTQRLIIQYAGIILTCLTIFYYAVVEKANIKNKIDNQNVKIERLELQIEKKVDEKIFEMILEDIREIKDDIKSIKNNNNG